jgi:hypothetical protein
MFLALRPLHRTLTEVNPDAIFVARGRRLDLQHRIRRSIIELSDWRWTLAPLFDAGVEEAACELGRERGLTGERLTVLVEAAQLTAALNAWRRGARSAAAPAERFHDERDGNDLDLELAWWSQVARAAGDSALVDRAVARAVRPAPTG